MLLYLFQLLAETRYFRPQLGLNLHSFADSFLLNFVYVLIHGFHLSFQAGVQCDLFVQGCFHHFVLLFLFTVLRLKLLNSFLEGLEGAFDCHAFSGLAVDYYRIVRRLFLKSFVTSLV